MNKLKSLPFVLALLLATPVQAIAQSSVTAAHCSLSIPGQKQTIDFYSLFDRTQNLALTIDAYSGFKIALDGFSVSKNFTRLAPGTPSFEIEYYPGSDAVLTTGAFSKIIANPILRSAQANLKLNTPQGSMDGILRCSKTELTYLLLPHNGRQATTLDTATKEQLSFEIGKGHDASFCVLGSASALLSDILHSSLSKETSNLHLTENRAVTWNETYETCDSYQRIGNDDDDECTKTSIHTRENRIPACRSL